MTFFTELDNNSKVNMKTPKTLNSQINVEQNINNAGGFQYQITSYTTKLGYTSSTVLA